MTLNHQNNPSGYRRLPADWRLASLGEVAKITSGGTPSRENQSYWNGSIPWITTSLIDFNEIETADQSLTESGLKNSAAKLFPPGTLLMALYGQGKTRGKTAILRIQASTNQACAGILLNEQLALSEFVFCCLAHKYNEIRNLSNTGNQQNLNGELVKSISIPLPPLAEQKAIAQVLGLMDDVINKHNNLIAQKELRKKWLMQNFLTGKKRLKGFNDEWQRVKFGDVTCESNARNGRELSAGSLMAVTKAVGIVPMRERVQGNSVARCKLIGHNYFAYNPMRVNIGSIARWKQKRPAMVSGDYVVFHCKTGKADPDFLDYFRLSNVWTNFIERAGDGSVRVRIYFSHLRNLRMNLPPLDEQIAIARILVRVDKEIDLLKAKTEKLKQQKQWLMQQLLTGKKRLEAKENEELGKEKM